MQSRCGCSAQQSRAPVEGNVGDLGSRTLELIGRTVCVGALDPRTVRQAGAQGETSWYRLLRRSA